MRGVLAETRMPRYAGIVSRNLMKVFERVVLYTLWKVCRIVIRKYLWVAVISLLLNKNLTSNIYFIYSAFLYSFWILKIVYRSDFYPNKLSDWMTGGFQIKMSKSFLKIFQIFADISVSSSVLKVWLVLVIFLMQKWLLGAYFRVKPNDLQQNILQSVGLQRTFWRRSFQKDFNVKWKFWTIPNPLMNLYSSWQSLLPCSLLPWR